MSDDLPKRAPRQLGSARTVARLLDRSLRIPGTQLRFGLDPILGLLPVGGDVLAALGSGWILYVAWRNGAPVGMIGRMMLNVLIDTLVGAVPVVGDLFDAGWQANARNVTILEEWLEEEGSQHYHSPMVLVAIIAILLVLVGGVAGLVWWVIDAIFLGTL